METVITIALLILYVLVQVLGRNKKAPSPPSPPPGDDEAPASLEDALREIREALEGRSATPPPVPTAPSKAPPVFAEDRFEQAPIEPPFAQRPFGEEQFERLGRRSAPRPAPRLAPRQTPSTPPPAASQPPLLDRLRSPEALRDAVILETLLGPPRARRRR